jgi:hypothetical protein
MATRLNVLERRFEGPLAQRLTAAASSMGITLYWLGQAGFVIQAGARRLIIDPYLSDTLAENTRGRPPRTRGWRALPSTRRDWEASTSYS